MAEYIERGKVYELIQKMPVPWGKRWDETVDDIIRAVDKIPAADVREERHGQWEYIQSEKHGNFYVCSECYGVHSFEFKFCHWCGAKMDRGEDERDV